MMALTANLTTVDSRKRGVTRIWKRDREAKASAGFRLFPLAYACVTNVCTYTQKGLLESPEESDTHTDIQLIYPNISYCAGMSIETMKNTDSKLKTETILPMGKDTAICT